MTLHHRVCHALGGGFGPPHAETRAVVLPHATRFNAHAAGDLFAPASRALGADAPGAGLHALARRLGAPLALRDLGPGEGDLDRPADLAPETPYPEPRPVRRTAIRAMLQDAWSGEAPGATAT